MPDQVQHDDLGMRRPFPSRAAPLIGARMTNLNILVTGTSRGIGEAIVAALEGHSVVGHSSAGGDGRIAADLSQPGVAECLWSEALERLGRADRRARQQCRHVRGRRRSTTARRLGRRAGSGRCGSTSPPPPSSAGSPCSISARAGRRADRQRRQPRRLSRRQPGALALCRVQGRHGRR